MKAVILAAGVGSRMGDRTKFKPKSMLEIRGKTLIEYQVEVLRDFDITEENVFVIGGHKYEELKEFVHGKYKNINFHFNKKFNEWNNIYTFYLIRTLTQIKGNFLLINSDTVFDRRILENLSKVFSDNANYLVMDVDKQLSSEHMKVKIQNGVVNRIAKNLPLDESDGEYIGLAKFNMVESEHLFDRVRELIDSGRTHLWYEDAMNLALDRVQIKYRSTGGHPWIEIDTIEDHEEALQLEFL